MVLKPGSTPSWRRAYTAAVVLADKFEHAVIATARRAVAAKEPTIVRRSIHRRLASAGVEGVYFSKVAPESDLYEGTARLVWTS